MLVDIEVSHIGKSLMFLIFVVMLFTNRAKSLLKESVFLIRVIWILFQRNVYQLSNDVMMF